MSGLTKASKSEL